MRVLFVCRCAGGFPSIPSKFVVCMIKQKLFPEVKNWPDDSDEHNLTALARRYFLDPRPYSMATVGIVLFAALQTRSAVSWFRDFDDATYFAYIFRNGPGEKLMQSRAGRRQILQAIEDCSKDNIAFSDACGAQSHYVCVLKTMVETAWSIKDGMISGWE